MKPRFHLLFPPTLVLAISALLSRFLGVLRDHLLAKTFGASGGAGIYNLDTYYAAFRIPDMLYNLLILGAVSAAFIPIFTRYKKENDLKNAWEFASSMLHLMLLGILVLSGLAYLFAPFLAKLVASGFEKESFDLTIRLMRIMLLSPILFTLSSVFFSIQDSFKVFFYRSIAPLFYNLGIIAGVLFFGTRFGVVGVTWGVIIGAFLQLLVQIPALRKIHYRHAWLIGRKRQDVRTAFRLMIPRILGLSLTQLTLIVNTLIASFLATGSITIFYLADNLQALPMGMIGISFAITSFATLSELAAEPSPHPFAVEIRRVMGQILFLIIPATIGLMLLRHQVVNVIFDYGRFTADDALMTASVLGFLLFSLFAQSLIPLLTRGFYAFHNTRTPLFCGAVSVLIMITGSVGLAIGLGWGITGIAAAFSMGQVIYFLLLFTLLQRKVGEGLIDWMCTLKIVIISILMGSVVQMVKTTIPFGDGTLHQLMMLLIYTLAGILVYFGMAAFLNLKEADMLWRLVRKGK